jgi:cell division protein FtsL
MATSAQAINRMRARRATQVSSRVRGAHVSRTQLATATVPARLPRVPALRRRRPIAVAGGFRPPSKAAFRGSLLDRLLRSRFWIWAIALALLGIVTMQVSLLKLTSGISASVEQSTQIEQKNAALEAKITQLSSSERLRFVAEDRGMIMPAAGSVKYIRADSRPNVRAALANMRAPRAAATTPMWSQGSGGATQGSAGVSGTAGGTTATSQSQGGVTSQSNNAQTGVGQSTTPAASTGGQQSNLGNTSSRPTGNTTGSASPTRSLAPGQRTYQTQTRSGAASPNGANSNRYASPSSGSGQRTSNSTQQSTGSGSNSGGAPAGLTGG